MIFPQHIFFSRCTSLFRRALTKPSIELPKRKKKVILTLLVVSCKTKARNNTTKTSINGNSNKSDNWTERSYISKRRVNNFFFINVAFIYESDMIINWDVTSEVYATSLRKIRRIGLSEPKR